MLKRLRVREGASREADLVEAAAVKGLRLSRWGWGGPLYGPGGCSPRDSRLGQALALRVGTRLRAWLPSVTWQHACGASRRSWLSPGANGPGAGAPRAGGLGWGRPSPLAVRLLVISPW